MTDYSDLIAEARAAKGGKFYGPISDNPDVLDLIARLASALESQPTSHSITTGSPSSRGGVGWVALSKARAEHDQPTPLVADSRDALAAAKALRDFADRKFGTVGPHRINMDAMYDVEMSLREEADRIERGESA